jgi:hypothetical protein
MLADAGGRSFGCELYWVSKQVADLLKVFACVNENFISAVVEGALTMAGGSIDLDVMVDVPATSGANILPTGQDVRMAALCGKTVVGLL